MAPSRTLCIGLAVHKDTSAGAYVAQDHGAAGAALGRIGTRPCDMAQRLRQMPSQATHLICVANAGPWGYWRYRALPQQGYACWGVAPWLMPQKPGDRVTTDRRDAGPLARRARSGALPAV
jgi:hypothetical protein